MDIIEIKFLLDRQKLDTFIIYLMITTHKATLVDETASPTR